MDIYSRLILGLLIAFFAMNVLATIGQIGKDRKPVTSGLAIGTTLLAAMWIFSLSTVLVRS